MQRVVRSAIPCLVLCLALLAPPPASADPGDVVATGEIQLGVLGMTQTWVLLYGDPYHDTGTHAFTFGVDPALQGTWLWPRVDAAAGDTYFVEIGFLDANGRHLKTECGAGPGDTALLTPPYGEIRITVQCLVPEGAATAGVAAQVGADLRISVVETDGPTD